MRAERLPVPSLTPEPLRHEGTSPRDMRSPRTPRPTPIRTTVTPRPWGPSCSAPPMSHLVIIVAFVPSLRGMSTSSFGPCHVRAFVAPLQPPPSPSLPKRTSQDVPQDARDGIHDSVQAPPLSRPPFSWEGGPPEYTFSFWAFSIAPVPKWPR